MYAIVLLLAAAAGPQTAATQNQPAPKPLPPGLVKIEFETLHCAGCARQVARNLYKTPGVMRVKANLQHNLVWVTVQPKKQIDLAKVWAATKTKDAQPAALLIGDKRLVEKDFAASGQQAQRKPTATQQK